MTGGSVFNRKTPLRRIITWYRRKHSVYDGQFSTVFLDFPGFSLLSQLCPISAPSVLSHPNTFSIYKIDRVCFKTTSGTSTQLFAVDPLSTSQSSPVRDSTPQHTRFIPSGSALIDSVHSSQKTSRGSPIGPREGLKSPHA